MALTGTLSVAAAGLLGFDIAEPLNAVEAKQYYNKGYRFCVRYVHYGKFGTGKYKDLTEAEAQNILDAGLALMVVQHPLAAGWSPNADLGSKFGGFAAANAGAAGLPAGVTVWLDLEGVKAGTSSDDVVAYCNTWFASVEAVGYATGVYIGANPGLTADELYWDLKTKSYWKGGSSAKAGVPDDIPHRGYQLVQRINNPGRNEFDTDVTYVDHFGDAIHWLGATPLVA